MKLPEFVFHLICEMNDARFAFPVKSEVEKKRKELCLSCEQYDSEREVCSLCNCYVQQKVKHLYEYCPIEKWDRDPETWNDTWYEVFAKKVIEKYPEAKECKDQLDG